MPKDDFLVVNDGVQETQKSGNLSGAGTGYLSLGGVSPGDWYAFARSREQAIQAGTIEDANTSLGNGGTYNDQIAMKFICKNVNTPSGATRDVARFMFRLAMTNNPGDITVRVEGDNSGEPDGSLVDANATATVTQAEILSAQFQEFDFNGTFSLTKGTSYWLVLKLSSDPGSSNYYRPYGRNVADTYPDGKYRYHPNAGSWADGTNIANMAFGIIYTGTPITDDPIDRANVELSAYFRANNANADPWLIARYKSDSDYYSVRCDVGANLVRVYRGFSLLASVSQTINLSTIYRVVFAMKDEVFEVQFGTPGSEASIIGPSTDPSPDNEPGMNGFYGDMATTTVESLDFDDFLIKETT